MGGGDISVQKKKDGQRKEGINDITKKEENNEKKMGTATKEISENYNTERSQKCWKKD
jgi:hypothetical protein